MIAPAKRTRPARTPRSRKPDGMTLEAWQIALRREFGREQRFRLKNVGDEPVFSTFEVTNPATKRTYRLAIRGREPGQNYCSCPDYSTIEHGMLQVLPFKKSVFAGVLDGGQDEVFLGGTRLKKFMESVEKVTGSVPEPMPAQPEPGPDEDSAEDDGAETDAPREGGQTPARPAAAAPATLRTGPSSSAGGDSREQALADLAVAGGQFLEKLCAVFASAAAGTGAGGAGAAGGGSPADPLVERDVATGRSYLRLPLPDPGALARLAEMLGAAAGKR